MPHSAAAVQIDRAPSATPRFVRYNIKDARGLVTSMPVRLDRDHPDLALYLEAFFVDHPGGPVTAEREPPPEPRRGLRLA